MRLSDFLVLIFLLINMESIVLMFIDKRFAIKGKQRVPEFAFVILAFASGGIGVILGALLFKHKTSKPSFFAKIIIAMFVNIVILLFYSILVMV